MELTLEISVVGAFFAEFQGRGHVKCDRRRRASESVLLDRHRWMLEKFWRSHLYCSPPNALNAEKPFSVCDPFSNPQPQELMQLLPHPEWAVHGYPEKKGDGWVGDPRTWILDVGALSNRLYFYQV